MAFGLHLQPIKPTESRLKHGVVIPGELGFQTVEDVFSERGSREFNEEVRERVQHDGAHSQLLRDLHDRRRRALGDRLRLRLVALLARREDHQPIAHAHCLGHRIGDFGAAALGRLRQKAIHVPDQQAHRCLPSRS